MPLHPELLCRAQTALILFILLILDILLQTTEKTRHRKTDGASRGPGATAEKQTHFRSVGPVSIAYAVRVSPCLRSGDRKLQECIGYNSKDLTDLKRGCLCIQSRCAAPKPLSSCQSWKSCFRQQDNAPLATPPSTAQKSHLTFPRNYVKIRETLK